MRRRCEYAGVRERAVIEEGWLKGPRRRLESGSWVSVAVGSLARGVRGLTFLDEETAAMEVHDEKLICRDQVTGLFISPVTGRSCSRELEVAQKEVATGELRPARSGEKEEKAAEGQC